MKFVFEGLDSQPVTVGLNNKFHSIYKDLSFGRNWKQKYSDNLDDFVFSLKLLDGKWGNFCYCPEKFLVVSVGNSSSIDSYLSSRRQIQIHFYEKTDRVWRSLMGILILVNWNHKRDSLEKSSSMLARSAIKKAASLGTVEKIYQYLNKLSDSRSEFTSLSR